MICCNKKVGSNILLGAFMYMAKSFQYGFANLELAGGHVNLSALCAYERFGFRLNITSRATQFRMTVNINESFTSKEDIINIFAYIHPNMKYTVPYESHVLCNNYNPNKLPQKRIHLMEDLRIVQTLLAENYSKLYLSRPNTRQRYQDLVDKLLLTYKDVEEGRVNIEDLINSDDIYQRWRLYRQNRNTRKRSRESRSRSRSRSRSKTRT